MIMKIIDMKEKYPLSKKDEYWFTRLIENNSDYSINFVYEKAVIKQARVQDKDTGDIVYTFESLNVLDRLLLNSTKGVYHYE